MLRPIMNQSLSIFVGDFDPSAYYYPHVCHPIIDCMKDIRKRPWSYGKKIHQYTVDYSYFYFGLVVYYAFTTMKCPL